MTFVGVDIGGTNVRLVMLDQHGQLLTRTRLRTQPERGATETMNAIIGSVRTLLTKSPGHTLEAVGVGITGPVDVATGVVSNPFTLEGWPETDVRAPFANAFGVPVAIDNDANVAAVGEWWQGAGMGTKRLAMLTIGTGIGVGLLIDGVVQRSSGGHHGEAGHMALNPAGPTCYCGANGCLEILASGTALGVRARDLARNGNAALLNLGDGNPEAATSSSLFLAAKAGDSASLAAIYEMADWLGLALVNLASTFMPDAFVLSGGVVDGFELFQPRIRDLLCQHSIMKPTGVPVLPATLGDDAGAIGAAKEALDLAEQVGSPRRW